MSAFSSASVTRASFRADAHGLRVEGRAEEPHLQPLELDAVARTERGDDGEMAPSALSLSRAVCASASASGSDRSCRGSSACGVGLGVAQVRRHAERGHAVFRALVDGDGLVRAVDLGAFSRHGLGRRPLVPWAWAPACSAFGLLAHRSLLTRCDALLTALFALRQRVEAV